MTSLKPPHDMSDRQALGDWAERLAAHFAASNHKAGGRAARRLAAAIHEQADEATLTEVVARAAIQVTLASFETARDHYQELIEPVQKLRDELETGSEDHSKLSAALDGYRALVSMLNEAIAAFEQGGPDGKARAQKAIAQAQEKMAALSLG